MEDEDLNPEERYEIYGHYEEWKYNADLEDYPDYFDQNGWPLFGEYDPYALKHPISGVPWHIAPREPGPEEAIPEYDQWYFIACHYEQERDRIHRSLKKIQRLNAIDPKTSDIEYNASSQYAAFGNLEFLRCYILPRLETKLFNREADVEFSVLWGHFTANIEKISLVSQKIQSRESNRRKQKQFPQKVWFAKSLMNLTNGSPEGKARTSAQNIIVDWIVSALNREKDLPSNFTDAWFETMLDLEIIENLKDGTLKSTFSSKHFTADDVRDFSIRANVSDTPPALGSGSS